MPVEGAAGLSDPSGAWSLHPIARLPGLRALAWSNETLYVSRDYQVLQSTITSEKIEWQPVGSFHPTFWRGLSSRNRVVARLVRDGFHALAVLKSGTLIGAVPGAIVTLAPGDSEFRISHQIIRGTRPLHFANTPDGRIFFGEYFDNAARHEVHIYASGDEGKSWQIAHTFPKGTIRHVHNIVYDHWQNCLWILTGDDGEECRILRASCDLKTLDVVMSGNQQARAVAAVPFEDGLYFASDTPMEKNHVYCLSRSGKLNVLSDIESSSIYGCRVANAVFFSTMIEPSQVNPSRTVRLYGGDRETPWRALLEWKKDHWPMRFFQYGNVFLPDGDNVTNYLGLTTVAVAGDDCVTSIFELR